MAHLTACDNCGKTEPTNTGLIDWWEINPAGEGITRINEPPPPFVLCSWRCVAEYAAKRHSANTNALPGKPGETIGASAPPWPFSKMPPFRKE